MSTTVTFSFSSFGILLRLYGRMMNVDLRLPPCLHTLTRDWVTFDYLEVHLSHVYSDVL